MSLEIGLLFLGIFQLIYGLVFAYLKIKEWRVLLQTQQRPPDVGEVFAYVALYVFTAVVGALILVLILLGRWALSGQ